MRPSELRLYMHYVQAMSCLMVLYQAFATWKIYERLPWRLTNSMWGSQMKV